MTSRRIFKKGLESGRSALMLLSVIFFVSTSKIIAIELYEPCDVNNSTACNEYNSSAVTCLPRSSTSPPEDGLCNCKWNGEFPDEYSFNETSLKCVALVGGHCSRVEEGNETRHCVENGICIADANSVGRCECQKDFMEDYENGTRSCVEKKLNPYELCDGTYSCKSFYDYDLNEMTVLGCFRFNNTSRWCDCEGNENEINYKFHNSKCLGLVGSECGDDASCYETSNNSTFCNEGKCECGEGFSANEDKFCTEIEPSPEDPVEYNTTICVIGKDSLLPCKNYSNTVDCIKVDRQQPKCLCKGSQDFTEDRPGYKFDYDTEICIALFGTRCDSNTTCVENAICKPNEDGSDTCQCKEGYEDVEYKRCAEPTTGVTLETTESSPYSSSPSPESSETPSTTETVTTTMTQTTTITTGAATSIINKLITLTLIVSSLLISFIFN